MGRTRLGLAAVVVALSALFMYRAATRTDTSTPPPSSTLDAPEAPAARSARSSERAGDSEGDGDSGPARTSALIVTVTGRSGDTTLPLSGAQLGLEHVPERDEPGAPQPEFREGTTGDDGVARFDGVRPGLWRVLVRARGHVGTERSFSLHAVGGQGPARWDLELDAAPTLSGRVVDPAGASAAGVSIKLIVPDSVNRSLRFLHPDDRAQHAADPHSAEDGGFDLGIAPVGVPVTLVCDHVKLGRAIVRLEPFEPGERRVVEVRLAPHTILVGRLARAAGPGERATVECYGVEDAQPSSGLIGEQRAPVAADGSFELRNLSPGRKRLIGMLQGDGWVQLGASMAEAPEGLRTDVGTLSPGPRSMRLTCALEDGPGGEAPAPRKIAISVIVIPSDPGPGVPVDLVLPPGRSVELSGLEEGTALISARLLARDGVSGDAAFDAIDERVPIDDAHRDVALVIRRRPSRDVGGIVVLVEPPDGVDAADLDAHVAIAKGRTLIRSYPRKWLGGSKFEVKELPEGTYQVLAVANGFRAPVVDAEVTGDRVTSVVARAWTRTEPLTGRVIDSDGNGQSDVVVELTASTDNDDGVKLALEDVVTAADGSFRMHGLPEWAPMLLRVRGGAAVVVVKSAADSPFELVVGGGVR